MCGIAGVLYRDGATADSRVLKNMIEQVRHRGPDGDGVQTSGPCGLAHARLAVIDLSDAASQPLTLGDLPAASRPWIVFNGEIYNFKELRAELEGRGHQ